MLRNRRKNVRKRNARNTRNRNQWKVVPNDEEASATDYWESLSSMSESDSEDSNSSEYDVNLPLSSGRAARPKRQPNIAKRNALSQARSDENDAGPSCSSSAPNSFVAESRNGPAKRKLRERKQDILDSDTSSDDIFGRNIQRSNIKRLRTSDLDSDDSESSGIQPVSSSSQRRNLFSSESSTSGSEIRRLIIRPNSRLLASRNMMWSDTESSNTLDQSSNSPVFNTARHRAASSGSSLGNVITFRLGGPSTSSSSASSSSSSSSSSSNSSSASSNSSGGSSISSGDTINGNPSRFIVPTSSSSSNSVTSAATIQEQLISSDSDSSDTDGEKCAICLKKFRRQRIGNPSNCEHKFCVTCIQEWSKSSTTCPVDRSIFDAIIVRSELDGPVVERIEVQNRNFGVGYPFNDMEEFIMNESITCEICLSGDDEETLLLCDFCNLGYHMACLTPPLDAIPAGSWYCPPCREMNNNPSRNMNEVIHISVAQTQLAVSGCTLS